jgi:hypothetical protein
VTREGESLGFENVRQRVVMLAYLASWSAKSPELRERFEGLLLDATLRVNRLSRQSPVRKKLTRTLESFREEAG